MLITCTVGFSIKTKASIFSKDLYFKTIDTSSKIIDI